MPKCLQCQGEFAPYRAAQRFCSTKCRNAHHTAIRSRLVAAGIATLLPKPEIVRRAQCMDCKKPFDSFREWETYCIENCKPAKKEERPAEVASGCMERCQYAIDVAMPEHSCGEVCQYKMAGR